MCSVFAEEAAAGTDVCQHTHTHTGLPLVMEYLYTVLLVLLLEYFLPRCLTLAQAGVH